MLPTSTGGMAGLSQITAPTTLPNTKKQVGGTQEALVPASAFYGVPQAQIAAAGYVPAGNGMYKKANSGGGYVGQGVGAGSSAPSPQWSPWSGVGYQNQTITSEGGGTTAAPKMPSQSGSGGNTSGDRASLTGLASLPGGSRSGGGGGGGLGSLGSLFGNAASTAAGVGAPALGNEAVDVEAPGAPLIPSSLPGDSGGQQYLSGPMIGRQGLGTRVPPSLQAMLKPKVY